MSTGAMPSTTVIVCAHVSEEEPLLAVHVRRDDLGGTAPRCYAVTVADRDRAHIRWPLPHLWPRGLCRRDTRSPVHRPGM